jgi:hypothetical protein
VKENKIKLCPYAKKATVGPKFWQFLTIRFLFMTVAFVILLALGED